MGTRSRIAVMHGTVCKSVYCHWDGYLEHNGAILQEHYDSSKANELVSMGDLSSLRPEIGKKHAFSRLEVPMDDEAYDKLYGNMTTFYTRDRGEDTPFKVFKNLKSAEDHYAWSEYYYCFKYDKRDDYQSGEWHYKKAGERWKKLAPAIRKLKARGVL